MPELVVAYTNGTEERFPLAEQDVFIGRDTQLLVSIPDSKISRRHARLFLRRGAWFIEDLGSVNGVVVDGVRISAAVPFSAGKIFYIGDQQLRLEGGKAAKRPPEEAKGNQPLRASGPSWALEVISGPLKGQILDLAQGRSAVFGRDAQADLTLADASISRQHARLTAQGQDLGVEDLGSSNGTYVADEAVTRAQLHEGDILRLGNVSLVVRRKGVPAQAGAGQQQPIAVKSPRRAPPKRLLMGLCVLAVLAGSSVAAWRFIEHSGKTAPHSSKKVAKLGAKAAPNAEKQVDDPPTGGPAAEVEPTAQPEPRTIAPAKSDAPAPKSKKDTALPAKFSALDRMSRAWSRLLGAGPSKDERARGKRLAALYAKALQQSRTTDRDGALATLKDLLRADPLHAEGRKLMGQLLVRDQEADALHRAQGAMQAGQALQTLSRVSEALDQPYSFFAAPAAGRAAPLSNEAQELVALGDQAVLQLSQACGERAQAACMAEAWGPCIVQLSCLLGYQPQAIQGLALLTLAADAVRPRTGAGAAPEAASQTSVAGSPARIAQSAVAVMESMYPQPALRQAVLVYSTGDIGAASQKLRPLTCPQCRVVGGDVRRVAFGLPRAKQLRESGQHEASKALYDEVLAADARLVPSPNPSVLHEVAIMGKQALMLLQGAAAFERGAYKDALSAYLEGQKLGVRNEGLCDAVARLSRRAQDTLDGLMGTLGKADDSAALSAAACTHLGEVLAMTAEDDAVHKRAASYQQRCKTAP